MSLQWGDALINGYNFEWVEKDENDRYYQCRGEVMYDDEHDEMPEPSLWRAAQKLEKELFADGLICEANHREKGWVEVKKNVNNEAKR